MRHQPLADRSVVAHDEVQEFTWDSRRPELTGEMRCHLHRLRRRFEHHGVAGRERCSHAAGGDGVREVPRGDHGHHTAPGHIESGRVERLELLGPLGVEGAEVDGLRHLGVALCDALAGVVRHRRQRLEALRTHHVRRRSKPLLPLSDCGRRPGCVRGCLHDRIDFVHGENSRWESGSDIGERFDRVSARHWVGEVGVGFVLETRDADARSRSNRPPSALVAHSVSGDDGRPARIGLPVELRGVGSQLEQGPEKVVRLGVLVESTSEVCDARIEVLVGDHR